MICSHCGQPVPANRYGSTHTLCAECAYHANVPKDDTDRDVALDAELATGEMRAAVSRSGHRWDQWVFSAWVCACAVALGILAGMWLAWVDVARQLPQ